MPKYIDIHCHILPGIDDGPDSIEGSLSMAVEAVDNNVTDIIATPHLNRELFSFSLEKCRRAKDDLQVALRHAGIPITLHLGAEIMVRPRFLPRALETGEAPTLAGGKYVLLEFPFTEVPDFANDQVERVLEAGFFPVFPHPERNSAIQTRPELLIPWRESGCLTQINTTSLTGRLGLASQSAAIELLNMGLVDIIGSDAHLAYDRGLNFNEAVAIAAKYVETDKAEKMAGETPRRLIGPGG